LLLRHVELRRVLEGGACQGWCHARGQGMALSKEKCKSWAESFERMFSLQYPIQGYLDKTPTFFASSFADSCKLLALWAGRCPACLLLCHCWSCRMVAAGVNLFLTRWPLFRLAVSCLSSCLQFVCVVHQLVSQRGSPSSA
jgi:hypothetical protein